jgi:hypothetical protein
MAFLFALSLPATPLPETLSEPEPELDEPGKDD